MGKKKRAQVNITVAIAVHPPSCGEEMPEVDIQVGEAGFAMPSEINEELDPDEEGEDED